MLHDFVPDRGRSVDCEHLWLSASEVSEDRQASILVPGGLARFTEVEMKVVLGGSQQLLRRAFSRKGRSLGPLHQMAESFLDNNLYRGFQSQRLIRHDVGVPRLSCRLRASELGGRVPSSLGASALELAHDFEAELHHFRAART